MTIIVAICVGVCFGVSVYMLLGRELKGIAMALFLLGHAAHLSIMAMSGSPVRPDVDELGAPLKKPPILGQEGIDSAAPLLTMVDPLPQALILTAIVIGFSMMAFLLTLIVQTVRVTGSTRTDRLGKEAQPR